MQCYQPPLLPAAVTSGNPVTQTVGFVRCPGDSGSQCKVGPEVVDSSPQQLEWEECSSSDGGYSTRDGRLLIGVGATYKGARTGGFWSALERDLHINCLELQAGAYCGQVICEGDLQCSFL